MCKVKYTGVFVVTTKKTTIVGSVRACSDVKQLNTSTLYEVFDVYTRAVCFIKHHTKLKLQLNVNELLKFFINLNMKLK